LTAQRRELGRQLEELQDQRSSVSNRLQEHGLVQERGSRSADQTGLETRLGEIDQRISATDKQIAEADAAVAKAAAVPGAVVIQPPPVITGPPEEAFVLGGLFMMVVLLPLSIALARRIWRRGAATVTALPSELMDRLSRLDQAVDSIAIEVERIGEGQRFMTRVFSEDGTQRALGAGAAMPVPLEKRDAAAQPLRARDESR
jgi:hypothetical protein